ncbi:MAG: peroxiredoxin [Meiothermus sp.]|nr:peroxiredoxin [Meiothermus sp.]
MRWLVAITLLLTQALAVQVGDTVALPRVADSNGKPLDLGAVAQRGRFQLFWFYPKALSPGCTAQAKRYSELNDQFERLGVEVYGVSADPSAEQCDFIEKLSLRGAMLPDPKRQLANLFEVGGVLGFYNRDTILVSPEGKIVQIWRGVNAFRDADVVLEFVRKMKR